MTTTSESLFPTIAAGAAMAVASLAVLQTDACARFICSPETLMKKRRNEYSYRWKTAVDKAHLQLEYCMAGGQDSFEKDHEVNCRNTDYLSSDHDQTAVVERILTDKTARFSTLKIDRDPQDPMGEFYVFLIGRPAESTESKRIEYFQAPLIPFARKLQEAFENQLTTTTMCFVADASSGKAGSLLESLVKEAKTGVAVVSEPLWMINLARLSEAKLFSKDKLQGLFFSLCRLGAWSRRDETTTSRTVMFTLPGQATVPTLLPIAQAAFPQDRHVFAYDGCVASVCRGLYKKSQFRRGTVQTQLESVCSSLAQDPIRLTTPLPSKSPLTKSLVYLEEGLASIPIGQAQLVETWMSSIDAFLRLKDDEATTGYLPYVLKLGFITDPVGNFEQGSDSYWSLSSLLQFVTGTRSQAVPQGILDSAREFLKDFIESSKTRDGRVSISESDRIKIENCVFQHKNILLGNKTIKDTVLPTQHWTLKQASRAGCSCCGPDPYDEEEEEDTTAGAMKDLGVPQLSNNGLAPSMNSTGYVDGKTMFAFDPTRFATS